MSRRCQRGREVEEELMRTRAGAEDLANGRRSYGSAVAREGGEADKWGLPVSGRRGERSGSLTSGTRSSVTAQRGGQRAQRPHGPRGSVPACEPFGWASPGCFLFSFSFSS